MTNRAYIRRINPANADQARWERRQLGLRLALFLLFFVGTTLAMLTLAN